MKKNILLFVLSVIIQFSFSQTRSIDSLLQKITAEKDDNTRVEMLINFFSTTGESNPVLDLKNAETLLAYSKEKKDRISEAIALCEIGADYRRFGNMEKSLDYELRADKIAHGTGNEKSIAFINQKLGNVYKDLANYPKAIYHFRVTQEIGEKLKYDKALSWAFGNIAEVYLSTNKIDSALMYSEKEYEIDMRIHYFDFIGYTYLDLGAIHGKMGNAALANSYYDMAINEGIKTKSPKQLNWAYTSKAQYLNDINQRDSSMVYAKKAIAAVQNTPFENSSFKAAKLLLSLYKNSNSDSALKYSEIYRTANDSLFNTNTIQQTQIMTFENELREKELVTEKIIAEEQRHHNIQFALIASVIIAFIILFLLFSRSIVANEKWISFFGVLGLLIVFEFINLLFHPWLASFTHESPVLMLLALVLIASLLIPLHHRLEKWIKEKVVEKNKVIRLAAAKKTIEKLEKER